MSDNNQPTCGEPLHDTPHGPATAIERRRAADRRHRAAGRVRLHAWLPVERMADIASLMQTWPLDDRAAVVDVAIRFLCKHSRSMAELEL